MKKRNIILASMLPPWYFDALMAGYIRESLLKLPSLIKNTESDNVVTPFDAMKLLCIEFL